MDEKTMVQELWDLEAEYWTRRILISERHLEKLRLRIEQLEKQARKEN